MEVCSPSDDVMEAQRRQREPTQAGGCSDDPRAVLTCLTFLEQKIAHLRGIISAAPRPPRQMVSAELSCIAVQLVSLSKSLAAAGGAADLDDGAARSPAPNDGGDSDSSDHDPFHADADADDDGRLPPAGSYEVIELGEEEILAPHVHSCKVCGKGFKRDANLRMHMRGHGEEYKTAAALAKPAAAAAATAQSSSSSSARCFYSCPFVGCKRNREHRSFQPLKTAVCVKNHYRRSHCDKSYTCRRCNVKRFSVLADLRTHEKHCGRDRWVCSCGTSFSRKDKLFAHVAAFDGHAPALPPEDDAAAHNVADGGLGTDSYRRLTTMDTEAASLEFFSDTMLDAISCSDIEGFALMDGQGQRLDDDGRGSLSPWPVGLDSCDFDGFDLFGAPPIDF